MEISEQIYEDLKQSSQKLFNINFVNPKPLHLGWLNLKWRVESKEGMFVLKQFSKERYERFNLEKVIFEQKVALQEQQRQYENGTPCPKLLTHNGDVIHTSINGERFIVMEYISGNNVKPGTLNQEQMHSLGSITAHMHNIFNDGTYGRAASTKFTPPSIDERIKHWKSAYSEVQGQEQILHLIKIQLEATKKFNLQIIYECEAGWAHRDLWVDNILFIENQVTAILDFDRFAFDYPELDVARAIMSGVLKEDCFNIESASAFLSGYRSKREFKRGNLVRALLLLWYVESVWWIVPHIDWMRNQEVQFANEMTWLAKNLTRLSSMLGEY